MTTPTTTGRATVGKPVNLSQLSRELGGAALQLDGDRLTAAALTDAQLSAALAAHVAQPDPPAPPRPDPQAELHAAIRAATTLDQLKAALLGDTRPGAVGGVTPARP